MNLKNLQQSYLCELPNTARRRWHSPDATLLALAVTAVRASLLDRVACGRLAGRFAAAAARRELAGHLLCVPHIWRNRSWSSTGIRAAAGWWWCLSIMNNPVVVHLNYPSSLDALELVGKVDGKAGTHSQRHHDAQGHVARFASGVDQHVRHVENGLFEISLSVCGTSTPAPSCRDEWRRQSCAAAAAHDSPLALKPQQSPAP